MGNLLSWLNSAPDMRQPVLSVDVFKRELRGSSGGLAAALLGAKHVGMVARTRKGDLFLIEKGVSSSDDGQYKQRYRRGQCRIVLVSEEQLKSEQWTYDKSRKEVSRNLTLQDLFDACGDDYSLLSDNCWHGVQKMLDRAKPRWYEGLSWKMIIVPISLALFLAYQLPALLLIVGLLLIISNLLIKLCYQILSTACSACIWLAMTATLVLLLVGLLRVQPGLQNA